MRRVVLSLLLAALGGCAGAPAPEFTAPYSQLATEVALTGSAATRGVLLHSVDGQRVSEDRSVVQPGRRKVTVEVLKRSNEPSVLASFDLEVKPCTLYFLAARHPPGNRESWVPFVVTGSPLPPCETRFGIKSEFQPR